MKIHKESVFYSTLFLTLSSVALQLMGFVYRILMSRLAGAEGVGVYHLVMQAYSILMSFCVSGLTLAVSRISAERYALGDRAGVNKLVRTAICTFLVLFFLSSIPYIYFSEWIAGNILGDMRTLWGVLLLLPCIFFTGFENIFKNCFIGVKKVFPPIISELSEQIVRILAVVGLLLVVRTDKPAVSAALIVMGMIISELFSFGILTAFFKKLLPNPKRRIKENKNRHIWKEAGNNTLTTSQMSGKIFSIAIPIALSGLLNNLLNSANTVLIPNRLMAAGMDSSAAMTSFGVLFGMTMPLLMLPAAFIFPLNTVLVPKLTEGLTLNKEADVRRKIGKTIQTTGLLSFVTMGLMMILGPTLARVLYNNPGAGDHIVPLAVGTILSFYGMTSASILNGLGLQKKAAFSIIVEGIIQLICTYFLVPYLGIMGYVHGLILSGVVGVILNFYWIFKKIRLHVQWRNWFLTPIFAALCSALTVRLFLIWEDSIGLPGGATLVLSLVIGFLIYALALYLQGMRFVRYFKSILVHK